MTYLNPSSTFNLGMIAPTIIQPLRYFFSNPDSGTNLIWSEDPSLRTIDIQESFQTNSTPPVGSPRILVSRGGFMGGRLQGGISHNLAHENSPFSVRRGDADSTQICFYAGNASVSIEARSKGVCELITDMTLHFLIWSRPTICEAGGWSEFGDVIQVSDCQGISGDQEGSGGEIFRASLSVPWKKEERWIRKTSNPELKEVILNITPSN